MGCIRVATNKTQRQLHARNLIRLHKLKGKEKDTAKVDRTSWCKLHVDPRELQSEVCEGRGSSMDGLVLNDQSESTSRLEYLARLLEVENEEHEVDIEGEQYCSLMKEKHAKNLKHHMGVASIMMAKQERCEKQLHAANTRTSVKHNCEEKVNAYKELVRGVQIKVKKLENTLDSLEETLSLARRRLRNSEMRVKALKEEHDYLSRKACGLYMRPLPLVYVTEDSGNGGGSIEADNCSFCGFAFPHSQIIVSACQHLYHPWCALVNFTESTKCSVVGCNQIQPIEWIMSFGWRGVRRSGRPGGGSVEWVMLTEDSGIATMEKLATRSEAASKLRTTI